MSCIIKGSCGEGGRKLLVEQQYLTMESVSMGRAIISSGLIDIFIPCGYIQHMRCGPRQLSCRCSSVVEQSVESHGFESHPRQLIFLSKSDCLGCAVLLAVGLEPMTLYTLPMPCQISSWPRNVVSSPVQRSSSVCSRSIAKPVFSLLTCACARTTSRGAGCSQPRELWFII